MKDYAFLELKMPQIPKELNDKIKYALSLIIHQNIDNRETILKANFIISHILDHEISYGNIFGYQTYINIITRSCYNFKFYVEIRIMERYNNPYNNPYKTLKFIFDNEFGVTQLQPQTFK